MNLKENQWKRRLGSLCSGQPLACPGKLCNTVMKFLFPYNEGIFLLTE